MKNKYEREFGGDLGYDPIYKTVKTFEFCGLKVPETTKSQYYESDRTNHVWNYPAIVSLIFIAHQSQLRDMTFVWFDEQELIAAVPFTVSDPLLSINLSEGETCFPKNWKELIDFSKWKQGNLFEEWEEPGELKLKKSETLLKSVGLKIDQVLFSKVRFTARNGQVAVDFGKKSIDKGFLHLRTSENLRINFYFSQNEEIKLRAFVASLNSDSLKVFFLLIEEFEAAYKEYSRLKRFDKNKQPARDRVDRLKEQINDFWEVNC